MVFFTDSTISVCMQWISSFEKRPSDASNRMVNHLLGSVERVGQDQT